MLKGGNLYFQIKTLIPKNLIVFISEVFDYFTGCVVHNFLREKV